ncbi:MAG: SUMF1/EgtB/PvdO family nonheme iron enzyme [Planctomycetota bacterium]
MSFEVGERIGERYRVEGLVLRREQGELYRVLDEETHAPRALAVEYPSSKDAAEAQVRARRAVEVSRYFGRRSAGFLQAHAAGVFPDQGVWVVHDWVDGACPLELKDGGREQRLARLVHAARRVSELHRLGIVHRSLRPDAFWVSPEGDVLLGEFGLARLHGDALESGEGSLDAWEAVLDHPHYLAPEQVRATYVDHRADLYALGAMLFEALVDQPPFRGSLSEVLDQQTQVRSGQRPPPRPSQVGHVPIELDQLCAEALCLEPEQRLGEAHVFSDRLDAASSSGSPQRSDRIPRPEALPEPPPGVRQVSAENSTFLNEKDSSVLVWVPGGGLTGPTGTLRVSGFFMGKYPVTWGQYRHFCEVTTRELAPARYPVDDNHPVHNVSYEDAEAYCAWAGLRLCRDLEWRYAAQPEPQQPYPWGAEEPSSTRCNWAGHPRHGRRRSAPVGSFPAGASPFGVLDLAGNVAEWVWAALEFPEAQAFGGSFQSEPDACAVGAHETLPKDAKEGHVGFRVALSLPRAQNQTRRPAPPRPETRRRSPPPPPTRRPARPPRPTGAVKRPPPPTRRMLARRRPQPPPPLSARTPRPAESARIPRASESARTPRPSAEVRREEETRSTTRNKPRPLSASMRTLLDHVEVLLDPIATGCARRANELKFEYGEVGYSFLVNDADARFAFLEQRVVIDPEHLYGEPSGRVNLLMASNAVTYFSRGLRCLVTGDRLRFRRELFLHEGPEPILRAELIANLNRLCEGWSEIFQPLRSVQEGVPWHEALAFLREKRALAGGRALEALEEQLADLGPEREGNQLAVFVDGSGDDPVMLSPREDLLATLLIRAWHPPAQESDAVKHGRHAPTVEALLEELNRKNATRPYALGWDPKQGIVASAQLMGTGNAIPPRERVLDCMITLGQARAAERFAALGE